MVIDLVWIGSLVKEQLKVKISVCNAKSYQLNIWKGIHNQFNHKNRPVNQWN